MRRAVFMDRDGTLNEDPGFVHRPEDLELRPGVVEGLQLLSEMDLALVVVTNQSGITRGKFEEEDMHRFHAALQDRLAAKGIELDGIYWCPHYPDHPDQSPTCRCRKPQPGLLLDAAQDLDLDTGKSFMIGDRVTDVQAGNRAGCTTVLIPQRPKPSEAPADLVADEFREAARFIQRRVDDPQPTPTTEN